MPSRRAVPAVLALDLGTSSVRSALFDDQGRLIADSRASQDYRVRHSLDRGAELDPLLLWRATRRCLKQTRSRLAKSAAPLMAGSGFWHSLLGLDRSGNPLTPIFLWGDSRSTDDAARLRDKLDERTIQQRTGCMLRSSFWPAKLAWLRRTEPRLFRRVARWASPAEWVFEKIFGLHACSHSMASGTGIYHLASGDWDDELLGLLGLRKKQLSPLLDEEERSRFTIYPAIGDGAAGNLGSGAVRPGLLAINVGTSAAVRMVRPAGTDLPFGLFQFVIDRRRSLLGGAISNAGNLRAWCLRELRLPNDERAVEKVLRSAGRGADALTILPFWVGERAPTWPENLSGTVIGLSQATTAADLLVAAMTASFDRLASILEQLEAATGRAKRIIVSGGILQSRASLQLLADSLGRDLEVSGDQEASLRGAAVYALEKSGFTITPPERGGRVQAKRARAQKARARRIRQQTLEALLGGASWSPSNS
ncbi:MAG: gluconokinase [Chthoniobacterales bacterium]